MKNKIKTKCKSYPTMCRCGGPGTPGSGMKNKKGGVPFTIVILFLIILSILISLAIVYLLFLGPGGYQEKTTDAFCSISTSGKDFSKGAFPELCKTRPVLITPDNWEECPYYGAKKEEAETKTKKDFKDWSISAKEGYWNDCTAEQFAKLAVHCWQLMGEGEANRGYFECYTACVSSERAKEDARRRLTRAKEAFIKASDTYNAADALEYYDRSGQVSEIAKQQAIKDELNERTIANNELSAAKIALDELEDLPEVAIDIKDIINVMKEATIEGEERTYAEILYPGKDKDDCCLSEAGFWSDVLMESSFRKALERGRKGLEGKILDGDVISIYFSDDFGGPLGILPRLGDDRIVLRYKTSC